MEYIAAFINLFGVFIVLTGAAWFMNCRRLVIDFKLEPYGEEFPIQGWFAWAVAIIVWFGAGTYLLANDRLGLFLGLAYFVWFIGILWSNRVIRQQLEQLKQLKK